MTKGTVCWLSIRLMLHTSIIVNRSLLVYEKLYDEMLAAIVIFMTLPCPYFVFIDTSLSDHVDMLFNIGFSLEDKRGLSLGELIRPFCIMISYCYLYYLYA